MAGRNFVISVNKYSSPSHSYPNALLKGGPHEYAFK